MKEKGKTTKPDKITITKPAAEETTEIICVIDRSTSMSGLVESTIEGYNAFIVEQRNAPGKASVTTCLFDGQSSTPYELICEGEDIHKTKFLDGNSYRCKGTTALLDALGLTIQNVRARHEKNGKPDKVVVLVMTDGHENASKDFKKSAVLETVKELREKEKWAFVFSGANIDSFGEAGGLGMSSGNTMNYVNSTAGVKSAYSKLSKSVSRMRSMSTMDVSFSASVDNLMKDTEEEENKS
jgi:hypothetical protein